MAVPQKTGERFVSIDTAVVETRGVGPELIIIGLDWAGRLWRKLGLNGEWERILNPGEGDYE